MKKLAILGCVIGLLLLPMVALADSISPISVSGTLSVGESFSFTKSVTISYFEHAYEEYSTVAIEAPSLAGLDIDIVPGAFIGVYDRSVPRTFMFDVTIMGVAAGTYEFDMYGLVDGVRIDADPEHDVITVIGGASVPEPTTMLLLGLGLVGLAGVRKRVRM